MGYPICTKDKTQGDSICKHGNYGIPREKDAHAVELNFQIFYINYQSLSTSYKIRPTNFILTPLNIYRTFMNLKNLIYTLMPVT